MVHGFGCEAYRAASPSGLLALRQEPLQLADLHRRLVEAGRLALELLRAHATRDVGQRVARVEQLERLGEPPRADQLHHHRDVDLHRAAERRRLVGLEEHPELAGRVGALLVADRLEPDEQVDVPPGEPEVHVSQVALVHQAEVLGAIVGLTDVRRDGAAGRPAVRDALEHGIPVGQVGIHRLDEEALLAERQVPDEPHEQRRHVVVPQEHVPQTHDEVAAELGLPELPRDGRHAVRDEQVAEGARVGDEPALEQVELAPEGGDPSRRVERLHLLAGRVERGACPDPAQDVVLAGRDGWRACAHGWRAHQWRAHQ
jgi:hypothetical protein